MTAKLNKQGLNEPCKRLVAGLLCGMAMLTLAARDAKALEMAPLKAMAPAPAFHRSLAAEMLAGRLADHGGAIADNAARGKITLISADSGQTGEGARNFIESLGKRAISFLSSATMSQDEKKTAFKSLLEDSFDMGTIGRFALGSYWRSATPAQRTEYLKLFEKMVVDVYSKRFSDYKGHRFEVRSFRPDAERDTLVTSFIVPADGPEIKVDWRVRYKDGRYQVVDVIVEGVSMSVTQRSDFSSVIQRGGGNIQVLLDHMQHPENKG